MSYDNEAIRAIAEVPRKSSDRKVAIIDAEKLQHIGFRTLMVTVNQLGLTYDRVCAEGENGPTVYMIVAEDEDEIHGARRMLLRADTGMVRDRDAFQRRMGSLLGYSEASVEEFIGSEVAATCPCACCGGEPQ